MTDKDIFDMADSYADWDDFGRWMFSDSDNLLNFVAAIQEAEREACAQVCEDLIGTRAMAKHCADAIRARGGEWVKTYCGGKPNYTTPFECPRCGHCCQHEAALAEREAILEAVEELTGMEADRHKMFSEGYDHALYHIRQVVEGRSKI